MKRAGLCFLLACLLFSSCAAPPREASEKLMVVATLFPQYDFARQIAGDKAEITLLLPPGMESHSFDPTPADVIKINQADVFLYTGEQMEPWAQTLADAMEDRKDRAVDVSANVALIKEEEEHGGDGHHHVLDPHIWTSPANAMVMVENILNAFVRADPANAVFYRENAVAYQEKLAQLDQAFSDTVAKGKRKELLFGGRFALAYFAQRYGLECYSAYDACSHETEPSVRAVADMIGRVKADGIPVVYYEELSDPKVTRSICEETGAKMLLFHSCHNVSKEELAQGVTYLSLMERNMENLAKGLE